MQSDLQQYRQIYQKAISRLMKQEYSRYRLHSKLSHVGPAEIIHDILNALEKKGFLSDARCAIVLFNRYAERGYGPLFIQAKMINEQIANSIIDHTFEQLPQSWDDIASRQRIKQYGSQLPETSQAIFKQQNYLLRRGFTQQSAQYALTLL
ncbi:MAG: regulatory protein RecX [Endozoicomonadaceae bacterium]|nr:regulatory protein RecX [Endozoicomonadaceae bacterium]MBE8233588.1 regulatory protein RecX [Endozoicomonadaceae bacterium]